MYKYILMAALAAGIVYAGTLAEKRLSATSPSRGAVTPSRIVMVISYVLAAGVFCVLAGLRSNAVGTDVEMYVVRSFGVAQELSLPAFFAEGVHASWMPLSNLLFWCVPNLTHGMFWMLFAIHAVIVAPLFVAFRLILKDEAWIGVLVFGITFFPISLNIMRQFMGMGFIVLSYVFVRKRRPWFFLLCIIVAVLFHESCLLGLLVYPIWLLSSGQLKKCTINPVVLAIVALTLIQVLFPALNVIAPYVGKLGSYINGYIATSQGSGGLAELRFIVFMCAAFGLAYCWFTRAKKNDDPIKGEASGLAAIVFFGVAMFSMCLYSFQLFRLGVFFLYFAVLLIPVAAQRIAQKRQRAEFLVIAFCFLALFGLGYYGTGSHEVVPYVIELTGKF